MEDYFNDGDAALTVRSSTRANQPTDRYNTERGDNVGQLQIDKHRIYPDDSASQANQRGMRNSGEHQTQRLLKLQRDLRASPLPQINE